MSAPDFRLESGLRQVQTLAPQLRMGLEYLHMPILELATEIRHQIDANPVLEAPENEMPTLSQVEVDEKVRDQVRSEELPEDEAVPSVNMDEDAIERRDRLFDLQVKPETLQDHLLAQVALSDIAPEDRHIAEMIIGHIDERGRFTGSFADIQMVTGVSAKKMNAVQRRILKFDPLGCGARDLQECLLAQMENLDDDPWQDEVRRIVAHHLDDLANGRRDKILADLGLTSEELDRAMEALRSRLVAYPGDGFASSGLSSDYVEPEISAVLKDGRWTAVVDERGLPEIRISSKYRRMLEDGKVDAETKSYIREHIRRAEAFREAVENRQETIRRIAQTIIDAQPGFFTNGLAGLRPLRMQDVADKVGVHSTTVSRTVNEKYMRTPRGTVGLRRFFTQGVATESGETVARTSIQDRVKAIIDGEDKSRPLSDDRIAEILKKDGLSIARRTVAKYRGELGIGGTAERRLK